MKILWNSLGCELVLITCLLCGCATDNRYAIRDPGLTNQVHTPLPKPTGDWGVGRIDLVLTETNRNILGRSLTNGSLMTTVWYPISKAGTNRIARYATPGEIAQWIALFRHHGATWTDAQLERLTNSSSHSYQNARLADVPWRRLILYVHGQAGLRTDNTGLAEELASHGFIVISSAHGGTAGVEMPDGSMVTPQWDIHLSGSDTNATAVAVFNDQTKDLQFILDQIPRLNNDRRFRGHIDTNDIGVLGYSYGGASAAELCSVDPRCKAGIALDPGGHPDQSRLHIKQPFLILAGTHGVSAGARQMFDGLSTDAYFVQIRNASHADFADWSQFFGNNADAYNVVRKYVVDFFNDNLMGYDGIAMPKKQPNDPRIETFLRK